jgi:hypothetical protein
VVLVFHYLKSDSTGGFFLETHLFHFMAQEITDCILLKGAKASQQTSAFLIPMLPISMFAWNKPSHPRCTWESESAWHSKVTGAPQSHFTLPNTTQPFLELLS